MTYPKAPNFNTVGVERIKLFSVDNILVARILDQAIFIKVPG